MYKNMMGTFSMNYKPSDKWRFTLDAFLIRTEKKNIIPSILNTNFRLLIRRREPVVSYDVGGQIESARNDFL
jgi:hypothetical protein